MRTVELTLEIFEKKIFIKQMFIYSFAYVIIKVYKDESIRSIY